MVVEGGRLQEVEQFCYLRVVLDSEAGAKRVVRAREMKWININEVDFWLAAKQRYAIEMLSMNLRS